MNPFEVGAAAKGWLHAGEGHALYLYASGVADKGPLVEIGGYCGKSACYLGTAAQERDSVLFSVDWHRGSPEMKPGRECHDPDMVGTDGIFDTLPHFRRTIRTAGLEDHVIPIAGSSVVIGPYWNTPIAMLFIDGAHDDGVVLDYELWADHIIPGGLLAFHDADIPVIRRTVVQAETDGFVLCETVECLTVLRRPA
jgi:predicted O-methyltransferase YrrM